MKRTKNTSSCNNFIISNTTITRLLCVLFHDTVSTLDYTASNGRTGKWRIGEDLYGSSHDLLGVLSWHFYGGTEENHEKSVRIARVLAEIRTKHLPHTSQQHIIPTHPAWLRI
jgi:hypothetical protein